ncbi:hypothetical protein [Candidatus Methylobacter oryzae]|uniref:Uncharacterized protein n=1 Tax=Candidatus Methylobacter oryzae TaxID=2497749 RepID=A0ABY3CB22_9GAMM|nr:hypothetical protein [Candidatus Methylobacter oryzae]TRW95148.1 hypothetical protein EKO24_010535 [Candidatus Methylobacter oryzae]
MPDSHKELAKSLNEIIRLLEKKDKNSTLRAKEMRRSLRSACNSIDLMLSDEELFKRLVATETDHEKIVTEINIFDTVFIPAENTALKKAGLSFNAKKILIKQTRNQWKETISLSGDYRLKLKSHLEATKALLNNSLEQLENAEKALDSKKAVQKDWRRISYLVGGAALVAIDASLGVAQPALAGVAAVSTLFGSKMVDNNLPGK